MNQLTSLTSENVHNVFMMCLFKEDENNDNHILVEGVQLKVGFNPDRLQQNSDFINEMAECLPNDFKKSGGGGWSFLNMCNDNRDNQWTDFHQTMDEFLCLCLATKKMSYLLPRETWKFLPGQMPYVVVN